MLKKAQNGRSIHEMLMTLAVMAVVTVGSYKGFQMLMTKNQVNNLIEDVKMAGFIVVDTMFESLQDAEADVPLAGKFVQKTSYVLKAFPEKETTFGVLALNVPYKVCEAVKKVKVEWLEEIKANGIPNVCNEDDTNEMDFFFNTQLIGNTEVDSGECRTNKDCPPANPYCRNGVCTKCQTGLQLNNGTCTECPVLTKLKEWVSIKQCHTCGEDFFGNGTHCLVCKSNHIVGQNASKDECKRCPNRCWDDENQKCLNSNEGNAFIGDNGICNYSCPTGQLVVTTSGVRSCTACPSQNTLKDGVTLEQCRTCGEGYFYANGTKYLRRHL